MLTRTLAAAVTLLAIQSLPTFAGPIRRFSRDKSTSGINDSDAGLIARFGPGEHAAGAFEKRTGRNLAVAAAAPAPQSVRPPAAVPVRLSSSLPLSASKPPQPSASAAAVPKGGASASPLPTPASAAAVPKGSPLPSSAGTAVTNGTTFPTAVPAGVSIAVPSDFPGLGPESGSGLPLVTTLFSTPAVAFSTVADSAAAPAGPSASAVAPAQSKGPAVEPASQAKEATATAKATSVPGSQSSGSGTAGAVRRRSMRRVSRESVLDELD